MNPATDPHIRIIPAGEFKAKCLQLMDEVNEKNLTLIITKRGKPVSQVTAPTAEEKPFRSIVGRSPDIRILGDIMRPMEWGDPGAKWRRANKSSKSKKSK
jgi:prevent-host-death family protein